MKKIYSLLFVALLLAACSDNSSSANEEAENTPSTQESKIFIFGSDYTTGELYINSTEQTFLFNQDSKVIAAGENVYVLERYGADNVIKLSKEKNAEKYEVSWQIALEDASNPSDIVSIDNEKLWLSQEGADNILQLDANTRKILKQINIQKFKDKNGLSAGAVDLEIKNDTLFVLLQRYAFDSEKFSTYYPNTGLLALYNKNSGEFLDTLSLLSKNPTAMKISNDKLYIASLGPYNDSYGTDADSLRGVEIFDAKNSKTHFIISGKELGGGIYAFATSATEPIAFAAIYKSFGDAPLMQIDLENSSNKIIEGVEDAEGGLAFDNVSETLYIGDRTYGNEKVYTWQNDSLETLDYQGTLPPYNMAVLN